MTWGRHDPWYPPVSQRREASCSLCGKAMTCRCADCQSPACYGCGRLAGRVFCLAHKHHRQQQQARHVPGWWV